jgi:hypothetical protein
MSVRTRKLEGSTDKISTRSGQNILVELLESLSPDKDLQLDSCAQHAQFGRDL